MGASTTSTHHNTNGCCVVVEESPKSATTTETTSLSRDAFEGLNIAKGGVACPFPWMLHVCLETVEAEGLSDIMSWQPHGRAFIVHKPKEFANTILPRFFSQSKYTSFQRQLNLYGFARFAHGKDKGAYWHLCFVRGHRNLVRQMVRCKIKGNKVRQTIQASDEPNFYDPAWESHFEASFPAQIAAKCHHHHHHHHHQKQRSAGAPLCHVSSLIASSSCARGKGRKKKSKKLTEHVVILPRVTVDSSIPLLDPPNPAAQAVASTSSTYTKNSMSLLLHGGGNSGTLNLDNNNNNTASDGDVLLFEGTPFRYIDPQAAAPFADHHHHDDMEHWVSSASLAASVSSVVSGVTAQDGPSVGLAAAAAASDCWNGTAAINHDKNDIAQDVTSIESV